MINLKKAKTYKNRILELIRLGNLNESLQELWKFHDHFSKFSKDRDLGYNDILLATSRFKKTENDNLRGLFIPKDYIDQQDQITPAIVAYTKALYQHLEYINVQNRLDEEAVIRRIINSNKEIAALKIQGELTIEDSTISQLAEELYHFDEQTKAELIHLRFVTNNQQTDYQNRVLQAQKDRETQTRKSSIVVQVTALRKKYPDALGALLSNRLFRTKLNNDFELLVPELKLHYGEIIGLVGENATGKSTLLNIIAGRLSCSAGTLQYPRFHEKSKNFDWVKIKNKISYVPQHLTDWQGSLLENISYAATLHGIKGKENQEAQTRIINLLGLGDYIHKSWSELSGGFRLRFALARALVWKPELLILDEPLAHLDVNAQITVLKDLKDLTDNSENPIAILVTSQHIHELEFVADTVLFMRQGKILSDQQESVARAHYEMTCTQDMETLRQALADFPDIELEDKIMYFYLSTPAKLAQQDLLDKLAEAQITLQYFRNISKSIKTKFYEPTSK